jgi:hypothetical protein
VSYHPFPRPVRHRALLRGRERRRGTTGPRLLPQRSARRAEGSWSGREETAREAPTLSCRTGRGPASTARRRRTASTAQPAPRAAWPGGCLLLARPSDRGATTSAGRPRVGRPRSPGTSPTALWSRRAPGAVSSAMGLSVPARRTPEGVGPDVVDAELLSTGGNCARAAQRAGTLPGPLPTSSSSPVRGRAGRPTVAGLPENGCTRAGCSVRSAPAPRRTTGRRPEKNWRESDKAGCEVSPTGRKWRLLW